MATVIKEVGFKCIRTNSRTPAHQTSANLHSKAKAISKKKWII